MGIPGSRHLGASTSTRFPQACSQATQMQYTKNWMSHLPLLKPAFTLEILTPLTSRCLGQNSGGLLDFSLSSTLHFLWITIIPARFPGTYEFLLDPPSHPSRGHHYLLPRQWSVSNLFPVLSVSPYTLLSTLKPHQAHAQRTLGNFYCPQEKVQAPWPGLEFVLDPEASAYSLASSVPPFLTLMSSTSLKKPCHFSLLFPCATCHSHSWNFFVSPPSSLQ